MMKKKLFHYEIVKEDDDDDNGQQWLRWGCKYKVGNEKDTLKLITFIFEQ